MTTAPAEDRAQTNVSFTGYEPVKAYSRSGGWAQYHFSKADLRNILDNWDKTAKWEVKSAIAKKKGDYDPTAIARKAPSSPLQAYLKLSPKPEGKLKILYHGVGQDEPGRQALSRGGLHEVLAYDPNHPDKATRQLPSGQYDEIHSHYTLNTVLQPTGRQILQEIHDRLKDNGKAVVSVRRDLDKGPAAKLRALKKSEPVSEDNHLYHVTPTENVAKILKQGILPKSKPTFRGRFGKDIRRHKGIYAFSNPHDALKFAHQHGWDRKTPFSIIKFKRSGQWGKDTHVESGLAVGDWLTRPEGVPAADIVGHHPVDMDKFQAIDDPNPKITFQYSGLEGGFTKAEHDPQQLKVGTEVEKEHTDDPAEAESIASDHLEEDKDYYKKLKIMESMSSKEYFRRLKSRIRKSEPELLFKNQGKVEFSVGMNKAREIRDMLAAAPGSQLPSKEFKRKGMNLQDLKLSHLVTPQGMLRHQDVDNHINSAPKHTLGIEEAEGGKDFSQLSPEQAHKESTNMFSQQHTPDKYKLVRFTLTPELKAKLQQQGLYDTFTKYNNLSAQSGHPASPDSVGWARYSEGPDGIHVDEIQTDLPENGEKLIQNQIQTYRGMKDWSPETLAYARKYHPLAAHIDQARSMPEEQIQVLANRVRQILDPGKLEQAHKLIFESQHPSHFLHEALLQHLKNKGHDGKPVHIWTPKSKGIMALQNQDEPVPGHMNEAYGDIPKAMGYKPSEYGQLSVQTNPNLKGKKTNVITLRKKAREYFESLKKAVPQVTEQAKVEEYDPSEDIALDSVYHQHEHSQALKRLLYSKGSKVARFLHSIGHRQSIQKAEGDDNFADKQFKLRQQVLEHFEKELPNMKAAAKTKREKTILDTQHNKAKYAAHVFDIARKIRDNEIAPADIDLSPNSKLKPDNISKWSIPAALTCPGSGVCGEGGCYAVGGTNQFGGPKEAKARNFGSSLRSDFVDRVDAKLKRNKRPYVRIHDAGDFYDQEYVNKWAEIVKRNPGKKFYAYSKSLDLDLSPLTSQQNFRLIQSHGGKHDDKIDWTKHHSVIFPNIHALKAAGYKYGSETDLMAAIGSDPRVGLVYHTGSASAYDPKRHLPKHLYDLIMERLGPEGFTTHTDKDWETLPELKQAAAEARAEFPLPPKPVRTKKNLRSKLRRQAAASKKKKT